jgi:hypothetical protein
MRRNRFAYAPYLRRVKSYHLPRQRSQKSLLRPYPAYILVSIPRPEPHKLLGLRSV